MKLKIKGDCFSGRKVALLFTVVQFPLKACQTGAQVKKVKKKKKNKKIKKEMARREFRRRLDEHQK